MPAFTIGERIREARVAKGLSASEFARRTHVSPTCVWNWERGATIPRQNSVASICAALNLDEAYLWAGVVVRDDETSTSEAKGIDAILDSAALEIAAALGVAKDRIKLRFEVSQN